MFWIFVIILAGIAALLWFIGRNVPNSQRLMDAGFLILVLAVVLLAWSTRPASANSGHHAGPGVSTAQTYWDEDD